MKAYLVTLYHDEPDEAATDTRCLTEYPRTSADAVALAQRSCDSYWQSAIVDEGEMRPWSPEPGVTLQRWVDGCRRRWYCGPTWAEPEVIGGAVSPVRG